MYPSLLAVNATVACGKTGVGYVARCVNSSIRIDIIDELSVLLCELAMF